MFLDFIRELLGVVCMYAHEGKLGEKVQKPGGEVGMGGQLNKKKENIEKQLSIENFKN